MSSDVNAETLDAWRSISARAPGETPVLPLNQALMRSRSAIRQQRGLRAGDDPLAHFIASDLRVSLGVVERRLGRLREILDERPETDQRAFWDVAALTPEEKDRLYRSTYGTMQERIGERALAQAKIELYRHVMAHFASVLPRRLPGISDVEGAEIRTERAAAPSSPPVRRRRTSTAARVTTGSGDTLSVDYLDLGWNVRLIELLLVREAAKAGLTFEEFVAPFPNGRPSKITRPRHDALARAVFMLMEAKAVGEAVGQVAGGRPKQTVGSLRRRGRELAAQERATT